MHIRYENTLDDIVAFNQHHLRESGERAFKIWRVGIPVLSLVAATAAGFLDGDFRWLIWAVLFSAFFLLFYRRSYNRAVAKIVRKQMSAGRNDAVFCEHELELTSDALVERTPVSEGRNALSALERIESTDEYTFIYTQAYMAHVIPHDAVTEGDPYTFIAALQKAVDEARTT